MFKKHMTPLSKNGTLHNAPGKGAAAQALPNAAAGGQANLQTYAKATPMAQPQQPAPAPAGLGSGSWGGNGIS
jgi:hypothetical protein